jgi:two-component system, response regulator / RNA-binding antiterminator
MRSKTPSGQKILAVDDDPKRRSAFEGLLSENGYGIAGAIPFGDLTPERVDAQQTDVIVINAPAPNDYSLETICELQIISPRPIALFCGQGSQEQISSAVTAGISAYMTVELSSNQIGPAIALAVAQFSESQSLRKKLDKAQTALSERKMIERAKGIVMKQRNLNEEDAFQVMRKTAMDRNQRLADLANTLIDATEILGERSP